MNKVSVTLGFLRETLAKSQYLKNVIRIRPENLIFLRGDLGLSSIIWDWQEPWS